MRSVVKYVMFALLYGFLSPIFIQQPDSHQKTTLELIEQGVHAKQQQTGGLSWTSTERHRAGQLEFT